MHITVSEKNEILVLITYTQMPPINTYGVVSSGARCLNLVLSHHLHRTLCMQAAKTQVSLHASLLDSMISTKISCAGPLSYFRNILSKKMNTFPI